MYNVSDLQADVLTISEVISSSPKSKQAQTKSARRRLSTYLPAEVVKQQKRTVIAWDA